MLGALSSFHFLFLFFFFLTYLSPYLLHTCLTMQRLSYHAPLSTIDDACLFTVPIQFQSTPMRCVLRSLPWVSISISTQSNSIQSNQRMLIQLLMIVVLIPPPMHVRQSNSNNMRSFAVWWYNRIARLSVLYNKQELRDAALPNAVLI